ncbi:MAG: peptide chain release factor N(5)-glutamine methyltransferase [Planctomycetota bacterium]
MDGPWTTRKLLAWTTAHFRDREVDSPRVAAEMLLSHVLEVSRLRLYMEPDRPASAEERDTFRRLVARAGKHEPVDYLVGKAPFFSMEFRVGPAVLIPRPSTETLVEHVLQRERLQDRPDPTLADVCTGSGIIAITLAKHLPRATVVATDLSEDALAIARQNADDHGVADRIEFRQGDLLTPLDGQRFDYLLANPPYISDAEWCEVLPNVADYEPTLALRGGADGLDHLRPLLAMAHRHLTPQGQALFEFAASQADAVSALAHAAEGLENPAVLKDHEHFPRVLVADEASTLTPTN